MMTLFILLLRARATTHAIDYYDEELHNLFRTILRKIIHTNAYIMNMQKYY